MFSKYILFKVLKPMFIHYASLTFRYKKKHYLNVLFKLVVISKSFAQ